MRFKVILVDGSFELAKDLQILEQTDEVLLDGHKKLIPQSRIDRIELTYE